MDPDRVCICRDCGFRFYINVAAAVAAIILDDEGRILLTRRAKEPAKDTWDLPGGFVDFGETAEEALKREVLEELNLDLDTFAYFRTLPNVYEYAGFNYRTLDLFYTCRAKDLKQIKTLDDVSGYEFKSPGDIVLDDVGLLSIRKGLECYIDLSRT